jgi:hypothetical protein
MKITWKEASKLLQDAAPFKYRGSALNILTKLFKMTYHRTIDDPQRRITGKGISPVMRAGHVRERQFHESLEQLKLGGILDYERNGGKIDFQINFTPLAELDPHTEREKAAKQSRERRTEWARNTRAEKRTRLHDVIALMIAGAVASKILPQSIFEKRTEPDITDPIPDPHPRLSSELQPEVS